MQCKSPWMYYPLKPSGKAPKQINNVFFWLIFPWSRLVETPKNSSAYQYIGPHCLQIITYESVVWGCLGGQLQIMPFNVSLYVNTLMFISLLTVILFVCLSACLCFYSLSVYIYDLNMIIDVSLNICGAQLKLSPFLSSSHKQRVGVLYPGFSSLSFALTILAVSVVIAAEELRSHMIKDTLNSRLSCLSRR